MIQGSHTWRCWGWWPVAVTVLAVLCRADGTQLLPNPGFEAPYNAVSITNSHAYISGQLANAWSDNSSWTNTLLVYSQEMGNVHGGGSALRVDMQDYPGYTNGALVQLYRSFNMARGRAYQASVWVRSSTNASVQLIIRQDQSPYRSYFAVTNSVSTNWQQLSLAGVGPTNVLARFQLYSRSVCSLWFDDASLTTTATNLFVDPAGSDTNTGFGVDQPLQTLQRAASAAVAGDTIFIRGGTYRETVTPANSGTPGAPIIFQPYAGEAVTVSGTEIISTNGWTTHNGSIFRAPVGWTMGLGNDQVFVDGQMMVEARWPNTGLDLSHPTLAGVDSASYVTNQVTNAVGTINDAALTAPADSWAGGWINLGIGPVWVVGSYPVISNAPGQLKFTFNASSTTYIPKAGNPYFLWGKLYALDAAGEWFNDTNAATLYLWTPAGDSPASHAVEARRRANAFDFSGRSNIVVQGIKLFAATVLTSDSSRNITLDGIEARFPSHFTYISSGWNSGFGNSGIQLRGSGHLIRDSEIGWSAGNGVALLGTNHAVVNCAIHDVDYAATDCGGVVTSSSPYGHVISSNTIYNSGRGLIVHRSLRRGRIDHNHLYLAGLQMQDLGATYCFGTDGDGTEIAYNYIHDIAPTLASKIGCGIYLDNGSQNHTVHHNVAFRVSNSALRLNTPCTNEVAYCNTLGGGTDSVNYWPSTNVMIGTIFINNIFTNTVLVRTNETVLSNNLYKTNDPKFVNAASGNFLLQANSPAIDAGMAVAPYTDGYAGAAPDIGAYESGTPPWIAGAVLRASDLAALTVTFTNFATNFIATGVITNFPIGRVAPAAFTMRLGTNLAGVTNAYNTNTHFNLGGFTIGTHGVSGSQPVYLSLDGVNFVASGSTVELPVVQIILPTTAPTYSTAGATVNIAGTASHTEGVGSVTWSSDIGGSGPVTGTTAWDINGVPLQLGVNVISITARTPSGRAGTAILTVTRAPLAATPAALLGAVPSSAVATNYSESIYSFTRNYTPSASAWSVSFLENHVFDALLKHDEFAGVTPVPGRSWELRMGRGGHIYSLRVPTLGETVPPQYRSPGDTYGPNNAPWVDEVWQGVAVDTTLNNPPNSNYFIHQSGVYLKDPAAVTLPFYSPQVAAGEAATNRSCTVINWGQHAHIAQFADGSPGNDFRSYLLYYNQVRDVGQGIIEVTLGLYNYGSNTLNFLNMPWGGVRRTSAEYAFLSNPDGSWRSIGGTFGSASNLVNIAHTGGWTAFSDDTNGATAALGIAFGSDPSPLLTNQTSASLWRWGYAGGAVGSGETDWRNYFVTEFVRRVSLGRGAGVWGRYYFVLGDSVADVRNRITNANLAAHAGLTPFNYTESASPIISYSVSMTSGALEAIEDNVAPQLHLYAHPVGGGFPIYFVRQSDGTSYLTWNPYGATAKPYDGSIAEMRLLGFALRRGETNTGGTSLPYESLATLLASVPGAYRPSGEDLMARSDQPPRLLSAVSRKIHAGAGAFDLNLNLDPLANPTVEPRLRGPDQLVFTFNKDMRPTDGVLDASEFTLTNATYVSAAIVSSNLTVNLTNGVDQSQFTVILNGLSDLYGNLLVGTNAVRIRALYGDVNQSGSVSVSDLQYVKNRLLQPVDATNFLADPNLSGTISVSDLQVVKNNLMHSVPLGDFNPTTPLIQFPITPIFNQPAATLGEALSAPSLAWSANGDEVWAPAIAPDGSSAARSGSIGDLNVSWIETTVAGPGTLSFEWKVSSELDADFLTFSMDGVDQPGRISGEVAWQTQTFTIPAGTHRMRWTYTKNRESAAGYDAGWLRRVIYQRLP